MATFRVNLDGDDYSGSYKGIAIIAADKKLGLHKLAAAGMMELRKNGEVILSFKNPVDLFIQKLNGQTILTIADPDRRIVPLVNKL